MDLSSIRRIFKLRTQGEEESERPRLAVERDPRFSVRGSVIYRPTGGLKWQKGTIENLSLSGMLLRGEAIMPVNTPVEMSFRLAKVSQAEDAVGVFCWGKVVRTVMPIAPNPWPALAVKILRYQSKAPPVPRIHFQSAA